MDNLQLSKEYLEKAIIIKGEYDKIDHQIKSSKAHLTMSDQASHQRTMRILYDMYLDCKIISKRLEKIHDMQTLKM